MKLNINRMYVVFTTSNYIENKQIKVLGYINYERASQYQSMVENIAINEKFIDNSGDTVNYLQKQTYYDCGVVQNVNGEWKLTGEHIILWDDIIDGTRTQILNENHIYKLEFKFKNIANTDTFTKEDVLKTIQSSIASRYNAEIEKVEMVLTEVYDATLDSVGSQLEQTKDLLSKSNDALAALASLESGAKLINNEFTNNNVIGKINDMSTKLTEMDSNINIIMSRLR